MKYQVPPENIKRVCELREGDVFIYNGSFKKVTKVDKRITWVGQTDLEKKTGTRGSFGINNKMKVEVIK